jgi:nucleoside-diphosphate-sugar epimerase
MKILVLGGSYFYGRVFVMTASGAVKSDRRETTGDVYEITVFNRGTYSMEAYGVKQVMGERHDAAALQMCSEDYDAVVDFCAYEPGDVKFVLENLPGRVRQYILISTVDVYKRGLGTVKTEETELEQRRLPGEAGAYIAGKAALEEELRRECGRLQPACTILRPAILYGPYNYAPRESVYIQMLLQNHALPQFTDADGRFQFVYVKDAAAAVLSCIGNEKTYGQAYNLCQDGSVTYEDFFAALKEVAKEDMNGDFQEVPLSVEAALGQGVPVPFPATEAETELCDNEKSKRELGIVYTDFKEGMRKTYHAFRGVYVQ